MRFGSGVVRERLRPFTNSHLHPRASPSKADQMTVQTGGHYNYFQDGRRENFIAPMVVPAGHIFAGISAAYNGHVARGWESKAVEAQQEEARDKSSTVRRQLTVQEAAREREREGLRLSRNRIRQQLAGALNPHHRTVLEKALAELEQRLSNL